MLLNLQVIGDRSGHCIQAKVLGYKAGESLIAEVPGAAFLPVDLRVGDALAAPCLEKNRRASIEADVATEPVHGTRYTENGTYSPGVANPVLPFALSPQNATRTVYTLGCLSTGNSYTLRATPTGDHLIDGID